MSQENVDLAPVLVVRDSLFVRVESYRDHDAAIEAAGLLE